jgi:tripartite ATP-independent transporter DctM subunit
MTGLILLLFAVLVALGVPMAFGFGSATAIALLAKTNLPLDLIPQRMAMAVDSFVLLAIPLFILGGTLMDIGGLTARLVLLAKALVGHVRGGLGIVVMVAEIFFSGISGSSTADTSAMGTLFIPSMVRAGYTRGVAAAIVNAATAMGVLVPPCTIMIFVAMITNQSVAALFFAGFLPAFIIAGFLLPLVYWQAKKFNIQADQRATLQEFLRALRQSFVALMMPVIVFGGILGGVATATEAAVLSVLYALIAAIAYRFITFKKLVQILTDSAVTTSIAVFMVGAANVFSWILTTEQIPDLVGRWITSVAGSPLLFTVLSMAIFSAIGLILEGIPCLIVLLPILYPIALKLGVNPLHYGIVVTAAVGLSVNLPPVGINFLLISAIAEIKPAAAIKPFLPYLVVLVIGMLFVVVFPWFTLVVPRLLGMG